MRRWLGIGVVAVVMAGAVAAWYTQRSADRLAQEPPAVGQTVSQEKVLSKPKPLPGVPDRPGRDRGLRPGESR